MRTDSTQNAVADMDLAQGHATFEAHRWRTGTRRIAAHAIRAIRTLTWRMPAALSVGDVPSDTSRLDMLNHHDSACDGRAMRVHDLAPEIRGQLARVGSEGQEQQEGEKEGFH